ncbi:MAG: hypothetical protein OIF57_17000, partial [Marinobacterium sp.]|nr:hypothetical protein [Marinobacterium sp.]
MSMNKDATKVFFPVTENTQLVGIEAQLSDRRPDAGFMRCANGISVADRQDFCDILEGLLGNQRPVTLQYYYSPTEDYKRWHGNSHQLSSYIAYARAQSDEGPDHPFPPLCATALLAQDGHLQPVSSAGNAFESKLKTVLTQAGSVHHFLYAKGQPISEEGSALLQQLEGAGVSCLAVNTVADIPAQLVGTHSDVSSASATQVTAQTTPARQPGPIWQGLAGAVALLTLIVVLYPLLSDLSSSGNTLAVIEADITPTPQHSASNSQPARAQQPALTATPRFTFKYPANGRIKQVKTGDTLSEGAL